MTVGVRTALARIPHAPGMNAGLWHDVYLPRFRGESKREGDAAGEVLRAHLEQTAGLPVPDGYARAFESRETLLRALRGGVEDGVTRCFLATVKGRMAVGLGAASVTENSVALLRAWGVPYVPGSALKGLASSAAHRGGDAWKRAEVGVPGGADAEALFGSTAGAGVVTFHDAWWLPEGAKLPLDLDVMTVHHADYYTGSQGSAPADWDEPNPVSFLTARGSYLVALSGPSEWVEVARQWLALALERDGVGAKTHAGYGRMTLAERLSEEEARARRAAEAVAHLPAQHRGAGTARQAVAALADALAKGADVGRVKEIARALVAKEPTFWKRWAKDATEAEKATLRALAMAPEEAPAEVKVQEAKPAEAPTAKPGERPWLPAVAWIAGSGKAAVLHARAADAAYRREARELNLKEELRKTLEAASEAAPVAVEVQAKDCAKLLAVRRR